MNYYKEEQFIAHVDTDDKIIGNVERWDAHKNGVLHRAITITVWYNEFAVIQHRKHPVFDNVFDLTVSSHQLMVGDQLESDEHTLYRTLHRELGLLERDIISQPKLNGVIYYKAKDKLAPYTEHEMCHIYSVNTAKAPEMNRDFAYGYSLQKKEEILKPESPLKVVFAPWVIKMLEKGML
jgi:isopentenyldiphosphate isomerase